tara:strand:- start:4 stop:1101 length:1098 start_codon:yes stop_codon:yes gene_type:complete
MKFQINKKTLGTVLNKSIKSVPTRSTLPVLGCAFFEVVENSLVIKTTNLEIYYSERIPVEKAELGKIAIPIHKLIEITNAINEEQIGFFVSDTGKVTIDSGSGKYTIMGQHADEFPSDPVINDAQTLNLNSKQMLNIINNTTYAASKDDMKPVLQGVYLLFENNQIISVATDGHKLVKVKTPTSTTFNGSIIVPVKFLETIKGLIENEVEIYIGENHIQTTCGPATISSRIIRDKYPDYEKVIPKDNPYKLKVEKDILVESVKRVSIFSNKTTKQISLNINKEEIAITTEDAESVTSAVEKIPCAYDGEPTTIGYNANFLIEVMKKQTTNSIEVLIKNPLSAAVFLETSDTLSKTTLLMPIRLND